MDFVSPILDIGIRLWNCSAKRVRYVKKVGKNVIKLLKAMEELKSLSEDLKRRVEFAEQQDLHCTNQVKVWLRSVEIVESEVNQLVQSYNEEIQKECLGFCPKKCWSSYKLSKTIVKKLVDVENLLKKGKFETVGDKKPRSPVGELPEEKTVGLDLILSEVWKCVQRNDLGIIGLYGMGGVGKTTLLKRINNKFFGTSNDYSMVIWVIVSKEASVAKLQDMIRDRLQIPDDVWNCASIEQRAMEIYKVLRGKKFVLLLDDVWKRFDLLKVGVPLPDIHNGSKVIFTTRSKEVCGQMEAEKCIRVECLEQGEALDLFLSKVGKEALNSHPNILNVAKVVAEECKGLPLALITVGRSMASRKTLEEWERALKLLRSYPENFSGIVDYVYHLLEFSYDSLPNSTVKSCFLYCSLFPKEYNIEKTELIDLWIGEGFLDELDDIHDARREGEEIIGALKLACLLETGESEEFVKMHDVIRDMALWLACEHGNKKNKFLVKESVRSNKFAKLKDSERISLWGREIRDLSGVLLSPTVVTLLVTGALIRTIPGELCESMDALCVLDLSGNKRLTFLPEGIGSLKNLQSFNLSKTAIRALPIEIRNLKKLRCLLLNDMYDLNDIPSEVVSSLSSLQVFSRLLNPVRMQFCPGYDETAVLEELERLECIEDISITISYSPSVQKILSSSKFQWCIRKLTILYCLAPIDVSTLTLSRMEYLEALEIWNANPLRIYFDKQRQLGSLSSWQIQDKKSLTGLEKLRNLRVVVVVQCEMSDMNWLAYAPYLRTLRIIDCLSIREVLSDEFGEDMERGSPGIFSCLVELHLQGLSRLKSITKSKQVRTFPLLKEVEVMDCPSLTKLPFDSYSAKESLKEIRGQRDWWDKLVWDDEIAKSVLGHKFVPLGLIDLECQDNDSFRRLFLPLNIPSC